jgi:hypothetical protein
LNAQVRRAVEFAGRAPGGEQIVMIKPWNAWAEGTHVEPHRQYGFARLEALAGEVHGQPRRPPPARERRPSRTREPAIPPTGQPPATLVRDHWNGFDDDFSGSFDDRLSIS